MGSVSVSVSCSVQGHGNARKVHDFLAFCCATRLLLFRLRLLIEPTLAAQLLTYLRAHPAPFFDSFIAIIAWCARQRNGKHTIDGFSDFFHCLLTFLLTHRSVLSCVLCSNIS